MPIASTQFNTLLVPNTSNLCRPDFIWVGLDRLHCTLQYQGQDLGRIFKERCRLRHRRDIPCNRLFHPILAGVFAKSCHFINFAFSYPARKFKLWALQMLPISPESPGLEDLYQERVLWQGRSVPMHLLGKSDVFSRRDIPAKVAVLSGLGHPTSLKLPRRRCHMKATELYNLLGLKCTVSNTYVRPCSQPARGDGNTTKAYLMFLSTPQAQLHIELHLQWFISIMPFKLFCSV